MHTQIFIRFLSIHYENIHNLNVVKNADEFEILDPGLTTMQGINVTASVRVA